QVLGNLLANAAKFSNKLDDIDVSVTREGNFVKFSVKDYGVGIPSGFKAHIFQRFSQADSSDTRKKEGSGLGLAISKELVEKMGGKIGFTSNVGAGTCFYFSLPAAKHVTGK
ncbi:MAG: ATP-binding protein, partial [Chitinophagaceae bacterium]